MITVQLLGGACLLSGDQPITGPPAQRHRIALLTLIVASWPQPLSRDRAMAMLWPEKDLTSARRLLNLAVHVLRGALGEDAIASTGDGLLLNPSRVSCDLHDLRSAIESDVGDRVARLYTAPLLDGFHLDDAAEFGYWLDDRRAELSHAYIGALLELAEHQKRSGDFHGRLRTCLRLVAADPHSGSYAQALMHALDDAGDRRAAIQHAADHTRRRRAELDLDPDPAVAALAEQLRRAPVAARDAVNGAQKGQSPSIAVLPFANLSRGPESEYFADGITDDVIAQLSKIRALKVIARASVRPFKIGQRNLREIGTTLGATTVLEGSVRYSGNRVRVVAKLVNVQTDQHLWAETYDRQLTDIFAIQTDLALQIAAALQAELSRDERSRLTRNPTTDIRAYQLYLRGRECYIKFTSDSTQRAIEFFDRAIARDPAFALAHAARAMAYAEMGEEGAMAPDVAYPRAMDAAARALILDPELSAAHAAIAFLKGVREFNWTEAEAGFRRAIELSPSSADVYDLYGRLCSAQNRHDEAIALHRRARELDPLAHRMDGVTMLLRAGRFDEAIVAAEEAVEFDPADARGRATLGWAYFLSGSRVRGLEELKAAVSLSAATMMWLGQLGQAYAMAGDAVNAREILWQLYERAKTSYVSPYHFAYIYTGLGEHDKAMDFLERAVVERTGPAYSIKGSFLLAALQQHPRFQTLLREMGLK